jgi:signal transduction histidine kinase
VAPVDNPLDVFFDLVPTGAALYAPIYNAGGELVDFYFARLNPAGQRLLGLPAQPPQTFREYYPASVPTGIFAQYCTAYLTGHAVTYDVPYTGDGLDTYFRLVAQRSGELLVVNFTDMADLPHSAVEQSLRESRALEQAARAAAEAERQRFYEVLLQLPAYVAVYQGPDHIYQFVNPPYQHLFPHRSFVGRPFREGTPESEGLGVAALFDRVYQTGEPHYSAELEGWFDFHGTGQPEQVFLNLSLQPLRDAQGQLDGVLDFSYDVTEQVRARRQLERLNQELEVRVQARTQQLSEQQGLLRQILGQVPAAIATLHGPEHRFTFFNDQYQALAAGRTVLGHAVADLFAEVEEQGLVALLDQVYTTGQPFVGTETAMMLHNQLTSQAETRYLDFIYQPLLDDQHAPQGILVFAVDVTEKVRARKQADTLQTAMLAAAQRQAQQRQEFFQILEQAPVATMLLRAPDHRIDYINPAYAQFFRGEVPLGRPLVEANLDALPPDIIPVLDGVYQTGETCAAPELALALPGERGPHPRYFTFTYQAYREDNRVAGVAVFATEVTAQVRMRQQAEAGERRLQLLTDALPVLIAYFDPTYTYRFVNQAYETWFHKPPAEVVGHTARELVGEAAYVHLEPNLLRARAGERVEWQATMPYRPDFTPHVQGTFVPDVQDGQVLGFYSLVSDVSELVEARHAAEASARQALALADELGQTNQQLTRTNLDLDNFIYTASHDLRAPITNIEGLVLLLREQLPAEVRQAGLVPRVLGMMHGAIERFQTTIAQLTDIARLQQAHDLLAELVAVAEVVEAVCLDLGPLLTQTAAQLTVDIAADLYVSFAPKNLRLVVYNLLSNAVKYQHPARRPAILLRAERQEQALVLTVQDNGLGLDERQQSQLFGLFRRLHTHVEGTGVGLYMVKRMVENAGGTITVQSQLGVGTTFTVSLPAEAVWRASET